MDKVNLATLCLNLYEGMEDCFAGCSYSVKPMPKDEAFNREIVIGEYIYCALQTIVREMIRVFGKQRPCIITGKSKDHDYGGQCFCK